MRSCFTLLLLTSSGLLAANLSVNPDNLFFTAPPGQTTPVTQNSTLRNNGTAGAFNCSVSGARFSVSPTSGNLNQNQQITLTVSFDPSGLSNGANGDGTVTCSAPGSPNRTISLGFGINGAEITLSAGTVQLSIPAGSTTTTQVTITRVGGGATQVSANKQTGAGWLTVTNGSNNTPSTFTINADATLLTPGTFNGSIVANCTGNLPCVPKAVAVQLIVTPTTPILTVSTSAFSFSTNVGSTAAQTTVVRLQNTGIATNYTITAQSNPAWLSVTPNTGSIGSNQTVDLTVRGNPAGLTLPTYSGTLVINSNAPAPIMIRVDFNIQGGSSLAVDQTALNFNANVGATSAQTTQVRVTNGGQAINYTAAPQVPASWLSISPPTGSIGASSNQMLNVTGNPTGLPAGTYNATVNVSISGTVAASFTVRLTVSDFSVASSADGTAPLSPGTIASIFLLADVANTTQVNSNPQLPTEIGGVSVTIRGTRTGLFFISPRQINFLVPDNAATGSATLVIQNSQGIVAAKTVQIVAVGPSLYTADATGTGPPAALVLYYNNPTTLRDFTLAANCNAGGCTPAAIDLRRSPIVILQLYGTGIHNRSSLANVRVNIGGSVFTVDYAGPQFEFPGLDQVNITLSNALAGRGAVTVTLIVDGISTKPVQVVFQ